MFNEYRLSHNPYFSRWFSAIECMIRYGATHSEVTILILVDGFLQYKSVKRYHILDTKSQSLF